MANDDTHLNEENVEKSPPESNITFGGVTFGKEAMKKRPDDTQSEQTSQTPGLKKGEVQNKKSLLTDADNVFDVSRAFKKNATDGTILTDKRIRRSKFRTAISSAFNEWFGNTKSALADKPLFQKTESPVVEDVVARENVVKEAAEYSKQAPRDDHAVVIEKLKTMQRDVERITGKPFIIKGKTPEKRPTWSHTIEETEVPKKKIEQPVAPTVTQPTPPKKPKEKKREAHFDFRKTAIAPRVAEHTDDTLDDYIGKEGHITPPVSHDTHTSEKPDPSKGLQSAVAHDLKNVPHDMDEAPSILGSATPNVEPIVTEHKETFEIPNREELEETLAVSKTQVAPESPRPEQPELEKQPPAPIPSPQRPTPPTPEVPVAIPETQTTASPLPEAPEPPQPAPIIPTVPSSPTSVTASADTTPSLHGDTVPQKKEPESFVPLGVPHTTKSVFSKYVQSRYVRITLLTFVIVASVGAGIGTAILLVKPKPAVQTQTTPNVISIPSLIAANTQVPLPLGNNKPQFLAALADTISRAPAGITQIYPILGGALNAGTQPASTQDILGLLSPNVNGAFIRALEPEMTIGSVTVGNTNQPFIILKSYAFDTFFAGMLEWESSINSDLRPVFGDVVTESLNAHTGKVGPAHFDDALEQNRNIRILYDRDGNERILYAFVSRDTVVITSTGEALSTLLSRM